MSHLTLNDVVAMAEIHAACQRNAKVARACASAPEGFIFGTARHVCADANGNFAHGEDDPRELFVRVTWVNGFDTFVPFTEVVAEYVTNDFMILED